MHITFVVQHRAQDGRRLQVLTDAGAATVMTRNVQITFNDTASMCRSDCTVPTCGDGILDGGEACDDGNTVGGDRCSADCSTVVP